MTDSTDTATALRSVFAKPNPFAPTKSSPLANSFSSTSDVPQLSTNGSSNPFSQANSTPSTFANPFAQSSRSTSTVPNPFAQNPNKPFSTPNPFGPAPGPATSDSTSTSSAFQKGLTSSTFGSPSPIPNTTQVLNGASDIAAATFGSSKIGLRDTLSGSAFNTPGSANPSSKPLLQSSNTSDLTQKSSPVPTLNSGPSTFPTPSSNHAPKSLGSSIFNATAGSSSNWRSSMAPLSNTSLSTEPSSDKPVHIFGQATASNSPQNSVKKDDSIRNHGAADSGLFTTTEVKKNQTAIENESILRRQNIVTPKWPTSAPGDPKNKSLIETFWQSMKSYRVKVRAALISAGKLDDPDKPKRLEDAIDFRGTCEDMCPEFEKITRINEHDVQGPEKELAPDGVSLWPSTGRMVKALARSAAGQDAPLPEDVRSPAALRRTIDYLIRNILAAGELSAVHSFLWDRTRAIRRDFVFLQAALTEDELLDQVYCLEIIIRFHVVSLHQMMKPGVQAEGFSEQQEVEQLGKALLSLIQAYEDCALQQVHCENEAEFRAYYVVFNGQNPAILETVQDWGYSIWEQSGHHIKTAVHLVESMQTIWEERGPLRPHQVTDIAQNTYNRFFTTLADNNISYIMACFAEIHFNRVRKAALKTIVLSNRRAKADPKDWDLETLNQYLHFDDLKEVIDFGTQHGLVFNKANNNTMYLSLQSHLEDPEKRQKQAYSIKLVESKRESHSLVDAMLKTIYPAQSVDVSSRLPASRSESSASQATRQVQSTFSFGAPQALEPIPASALTTQSTTPTIPFPATKFAAKPTMFAPKQAITQIPSNSTPLGSIGSQTIFPTKPVLSANTPDNMASKSSPTSAQSSMSTFQVQPPFGSSTALSALVTTQQPNNQANVPAPFQVPLPALVPAPVPTPVQSPVQSPSAFVETPPTPKFSFLAPKATIKVPESSLLPESDAKVTSTEDVVSSVPVEKSLPISTPVKLPPVVEKVLIDPFIVLADWTAIGEGGILDMFTEWTVGHIVADVYQQCKSEEEARLAAEEHERTEAQIAAFRLRTLATKYGYMWRAKASQRWLRRKGKQDRDVRRRMAEESIRKQSKSSEEKTAKKVNIVEDFRATASRGMDKLRNSKSSISGDGSRRSLSVYSARNPDPGVHCDYVNACKRVRRATSAQHLRHDADNQSIKQFSNSHVSTTPEGSPSRLRTASARSSTSSSDLRNSKMADRMSVRDIMIEGFKSTSRISLIPSYDPALHAAKKAHGVQTPYFRHKARGLLSQDFGSSFSRSSSNSRRSLDFDKTGNMQPSPTHRMIDFDQSASSVQPKDSKVDASVPQTPYFAPKTAATALQRFASSFPDAKSNGDVSMAAKASVQDHVPEPHKRRKRMSDASDEELFAKAKRIRDQMDEGAKWFREQRKEFEKTYPS